MPRKAKSVSPKVTKKLGAVKKAKKEKNYKLEAHLNNMVLKTSGATLLEAITKFVNHKKFPFAVKTKVFLKYSFGKGRKKVERHKLLPLAGARTILRRLKFSEDQALFLSEKLNHELTY